MTEPKNQHIIPRCYLRQFVDPNTPVGQEPYVWIFDRESKRGKKRAPRNILAESDFYTLKVESGGKDYSIEKTLAQIEGEYASVFENKVRKRLPLDNYEHIVLCAFVAATLQRTQKQKEHLEKMLDQVIAMTEEMERERGLPPAKSEELKKQKEDAHKLSVMQMIPHVTQILMQMNVAFLCTNKKGSFITSDAPCFLFSSRLQGQGFYGPGLRQKYVEVRMPLSPEISVSFTWANNLRGYLEIDTDWIHESNRMVFGHSHQQFIANAPTIKRRWFHRFPLDPIFVVRILKLKLGMKLSQFRKRSKYHV